MKRWLLLFVLAMGLGPGCDVATVALLMSAQDDGSDDDDPLTSPGPVSQVWIGQIADPIAAEADLVNANGAPSTAVWTRLADLVATDVFDPDNATVGAFNAILIQVSSAESFNLDSVEILDANNQVIENASGTAYSNLVTTPNNILGPPDGVPAVTDAGAIGAFIFTLFTTNPIDKFRINGQETSRPRVPSDIITVAKYVSPSAERPGGLAIRSSDGVIHITLSVGDAGRLVRFERDIDTGLLVFKDHVDITNDLATAGSHAVVVNSAGTIYTSASTQGGVIQIRSFDGLLTPTAAIGPSSGLGGDRVEHNSIALDGTGNVIVVGGFSSLLSGRNHWRIKLPQDITAAAIWQSSSSLDSASDTYWHGVTTDANDEVLTTGNLFDGALFGGTNQVYSTRFTAAGGATWADDYIEGSAPSDVGHAIALDLPGNIYVAGSVGTASTALDRVLLRYNSLGNLTTPLILTAAGNDEILDITIDSDGAIYVVGYITVAGQGEDIWVRKYTYDAVENEFDTAWTRTHDGGFGDNDRAISCAISGTSLVVAGYETNSTGQTKLVLRMYEK